MPAFTQQEVFRDAALILQDRAFARWAPDIMNAFLNAAIREVALNKPNAVEETVTLALQPGTHQEIADPDFALMRVLRNASGAAISEVSRETMDGMVPGWGDTAVYPAAASVQHILFDVAQPTVFQVFPSNDGTGQIEAVVARMPAALADGTDPADVNTFTADVPLPAIYRQALTDYVIAKCFMMDSIAPASAARAQAHYGLFAQAIGIKFRAEQIASPKTTNAASQSGG